ncbi:hypothetical protein M0R04_06940 [Candidatus Dojkabacteria bacterium]|jgi:archaellum biogenesis ATPase FlaH|nr:hypothetical protein [Candidatus Dojkabacteria bacterium]
MDNTPQQQKLLIEYLISDTDTFTLCKSIVVADYFNPTYRNCVAFLHEYYNKYGALPEVDLIEAKTDVQLKKRNITKDQINFCADEIEKFCRDKAMEAAVIKSAALIGTDNASEIEKLIRDAVSISLNKDLGVNYFDNPLSRLETYAKEPQRISTGLRDVDEMLGGGAAKTELLLVSANSGGGKSIVLANLGVNMFMQGYAVLYISLELSEKMIEERFNTMITGISTIGWTDHIYEIADTVEMVGSACGGHLNIKRMNSGATSNQIRAYIKEYQLKLGITPDVLIVDYLDKMNPNERVSADNISQKDKLSAEQLVDVLIEYNMMGFSASQQNREAINATELNQGHIAGGLTKINAVDWYFSIIFNQKMKAEGTMMWQCLKSRSSDAEGKQVGFIWDNTFLRIKNALTKVNFDDDGVIIDSIAAKKLQHGKKKTLKDLMDVGL